jgi:hypothetical protein
MTKRNIQSSDLPSSVVNASSGTAPLTYGNGANTLINLPPFEPYTVYSSGFSIVNKGDVYVRNTTGTSGVSWAADAANWTALGNSTVVTGGSLGATQTLTLNSPRVQYTGTLTANCVLTVVGLTAGCSAVLLLEQDATGGRTLTISNGSSSQAVTIPTSANAAVAVSLWSPDGSTIYVEPGPQSGTNGTNGTRGSEWFTYNGSGTPSGITGMIADDMCLRADGEVFEYSGSAWTDTGINIKGANGSSAASLDTLRIQAWGIQSEPFPMIAASQNAVLTSGRMEGALIGLTAGMTLTGVVVALEAVAASLTGLYVALYSSSGTLLTTSPQNQPSALNAGALSVISLPFFASGTYSVPSNGGYYAIILAVGTTPPTLYRAATASEDGGIGSGVPLFVFQTGQTSPANATFVKEAQPYWIGVY